MDRIYARNKIRQPDITVRDVLMYQVGNGHNLYGELWQRLPVADLTSTFNSFLKHLSDLIGHAQRSYLLIYFATRPSSGQ